MSRGIIIPPNPMDTPQRLLDKYAKAGPRYTSYPTAPHFRSDIDPGRIIERWQKGAEAENRPDLSLYIHIPFCKTRCLYCGCFTKVGSDPSSVDPYLKALENELRLTSEIIGSDRPVAQLSFGGGTPTFLSPDRFEGLLDCIEDSYSFAVSPEKAIELDPRSVTDEHVELLLEHSFNRFSLGVQDLDENVQSIIGRRQGEDSVISLMDKLRNRGKNAINFDLIYGLPGQTAKTMEATARRVAQIAPSRIALFNYAHVPWMMKHQKVLEKYEIPTAEKKLELFGTAYAIFVEAGYIPVGMDHFARVDDELVLAMETGGLHRNFMGYTTKRGLDLAGAGASAIASISDSYSQNAKDIERYCKGLNENRLPIERGFLLSDEDAMRRELIIDLFCNFKINTAEFGERWSVDFADTFLHELKLLEDFEKDGLIEIAADSLKVSSMGRLFIRNICMAFDSYLERDPGQRRYSQTV